MITRIITLLFLLLIAASEKATAQVCIAANDFGQGGYVFVPAKPGTDGGVTLLETKTSDQVATWIATDMYTGGVSVTDANGNKIQRNVLKIYVDGRWYPYGRDGEAVVNTAASGAKSQDCKIDTKISACVLDDCIGPRDPRANDSICLTGDGKTLDIGGEKRDKIPCCMDGGYGLYGLIALEKNDLTRADPNKNAKIAKTPPTFDFRTFRVAPLSSDKNGKFAEILVTEQCNLNASDNTVCLGDPSGEGSDIIARGRLYFQIKDRYYDDNEGFYTLNVVSGVYGLRGFIEETVNAFKTQLLITSQGLYNLVTKDWKFISIVRAMLLLYVVLFGAMFAMGMIKATQAELVIRLFKIAIVSILISDQSFEFFNMYLFSIVNTGSENIAKIIYDSTLFYSDNTTAAKFIIPDQASPLSIYDILVKMLISRSLHIKIWSILFVKWYIIMIPFLYVALFFILGGIIRAVVVYVTAIVLMALMLVIAPIFIAMILFQLTRQLFDGWLKLFISTGMMMIVVAAVLAITVSLFMNQTENLFSYGVCWTFIRTIVDKEISFLGIHFLDWFDLYYWYPSDLEEAKTHLTTKNFFAFLFFGVIFNKIMKEIPQLIDTLASSNLMPFSRFTAGANQRLDQAAAMAADVAQAVPAYVLMDNAAAQYLAKRTGLSDKWGAAMDKLKDSNLAKAKRMGEKLVGTALNAPGALDVAMHTNEQPQAGLFNMDAAKYTALKTVQNVQQGYKEGHESKWYDPGISKEVKDFSVKIGWNKRQ